MKEQELNQLIHEYEGLFRKVLYKFEIFSQHPDFDDYLQELRIVFYQEAAPYESIHAFREDKSVTYRMNPLLWKCKDLLRKQNRRTENVQVGLGEWDRPDDVDIQQADTQLVLAQFVTTLTPKEHTQFQRFLCPKPEDTKQQRHYIRKKFRGKFTCFLAN